MLAVVVAVTVRDVDAAGTRATAIPANVPVADKTATCLFR
jgi:hypothetical protein